MDAYKSDYQPENKIVVPKDQWELLSFDELIQQKSILLDRWEFLNSINNNTKDIFIKAIEEIDEYISKKYLSSP